MKGGLWRLFSYSGEEGTVCGLASNVVVIPEGGRGKSYRDRKKRAPDHNSLCCERYVGHEKEDTFSFILHSSGYSEKGKAQSLSLFGKIEQDPGGVSSRGAAPIARKVLELRVS